MITERTKLLNNQQSNTVADTTEEVRKKKIERMTNRIVYPISAVVALPTSVLSGLAVVQGASGHLGSLKDLEAIIELLADQPAGTLIYGAASLLATEIVLTCLNKKYLLGSAKTVLELLKRDFNYLKASILCRQFDGTKPSVIENGLFVWCFVTSLIFAEIGKETMSFLGTAGEQIGFYLNLVVYFATRFAGARRFFLSAIERNTSEQSPSEKMSVQDKLLMFAGYLFALISALPIVINFIPESDRGLQSLMHSDLSFDPLYQNAVAISMGIMASLPTVFFYSVSIKDLPKHLLKTGSLGYEKIQQRQAKDVFGLLLMTVFAFGASYFSSIGFRLVGSSNVTQGYLSYLGEGIEQLMPDSLFAGVILMFWSHLQHLVNEHYKAPTPTVATNRNSLFAGSKPNDQVDAPISQVSLEV